MTRTGPQAPRAAPWRVQVAVQRSEGVPERCPAVEGVKRLSPAAELERRPELAGTSPTLTTGLAAPSSGNAGCSRGERELEDEIHSVASITSESHAMMQKIDYRFELST